MRRHHDGADALPKGVSGLSPVLPTKSGNEDFYGDDRLGDAVKHAGEHFDLAFYPRM